MKKIKDKEIKSKIIFCVFLISIAFLQISLILNVSITPPEQMNMVIISLFILILIFILILVIVFNAIDLHALRKEEREKEE